MVSLLLGNLSSFLSQGQHYSGLSEGKIALFLPGTTVDLPLLSLWTTDTEPKAAKVIGALASLLPALCLSSQTRDKCSVTWHKKLSPLTSQVSKSRVHPARLEKSYSGVKVLYLIYSWYLDQQAGRPQACGIQHWLFTMAIFEIMLWLDGMFYTL